MARRRALAHAVPTGQTRLPIQLHGENAPALPAAGKGQSGRLLRRPQRDRHTAIMANFRTRFQPNRHPAKIPVARFERPTELLQKPQQFRVPRAATVAHCRNREARKLQRWTCHDQTQARSVASGETVRQCRQAACLGGRGERGEELRHRGDHSAARPNSASVVSTTPRRSPPGETSTWGSLK